MCQDYIQKQRQLQYESHTMTQPGYSAVMDYVDKIGDNLKTPKVLLSITQQFSQIHNFLKQHSQKLYLG